MTASTHETMDGAALQGDGFESLRLLPLHLFEHRARQGKKQAFTVDDQVRRNAAVHDAGQDALVEFPERRRIRELGAIGTVQQTLESLMEPIAGFEHHQFALDSVGLFPGRVRWSLRVNLSDQCPA